LAEPRTPRPRRKREPGAPDESKVQGPRSKAGAPLSPGDSSIAAAPRGPRPRRKREPAGAVEAPPADLIVIGRIARPWGLYGDLKVIVQSDVPERFADLTRVFLDGRPYRVRRSKHEGPFARLALAGITSREAADDLRGQFVEIPQSETAPLPEGQFYHFQIIGLRALTEAGEEIGTVSDVIPTGANDVYLVQGPKGEILVPAIEDVVRSIDLDAGTLTVAPIEGMFPEPREPRPRRRPQGRPKAGP
jgi:16S rRNA processing protein RimM